MNRLLALALLSILAPGCPSGPGTVDAPSGLDTPAVDAPVGDVPSVDAPGADTPSTVDAPLMADTPAVIDGGACTNDTSAIGNDCTSDGDCPAGYVCQGFSGVIFTQSCQILCAPGACPCPSGTACTTVGDKGGTWMQCTSDV